MARTYTYDDFKKALAASGLSGQFSDADLKLAERDPDAGMSILSYKQDYNNATTDEARALANAGANAIRSSFGEYTAGTDGSSFYKTSDSPGSFGYAAPAPTYKNSYEADINSMIGDIMNNKEFSYDPETDPLYSSYKKTYTREGKRATADTLGDVAAATGGIPSSYAVTAANQAGNYYASQLADKVPELYQMAYDKYLNDFNMRLDKLGVLQDREQFEYSRYLDELAQYENDRNFNYAQWLDELEARANDAAARENARQAALSEAYAAAEYGDFSQLKALGVNPDFDFLAALNAKSNGTAGSATDTAVNEELRATVEQVMKTYPDGVITDAKTWQMLVDRYGEDAVKAAGLTYGVTDNSNVILPSDNPYFNRLPTRLDTEVLDNTWTQEKIDDVAGNVSALVEMMKKGDVDIRTKDDVRAAIYAAYPQYANDEYFALLVEDIISSLTKEANGGKGVGGPGGKLSYKENYK